MAFGFLKTIVRTAGAPTRLLAKGVGKIPVVGKPFKAVVNLTVGAPFALADSIARGERIDRAVLNNIKQQVKDVKEVGPYAQMVVSLVPGVGTGISAGLAAGLALADGQPITAALKAGVEGALPGGPVAKMAFNASVAIAQGKPVDQVAIAAMPLPDAQKKALRVTVDAAKAVASGKRIDKVAVDAAMKSLPPDIAKGVNIGLAIGQGQKLQSVMKKNVTPAALTTLAGKGGVVVTVNPVMKAGFNAMKNKSEKAGFSVGAAMSRLKVKPAEVVAVREKLKGAQKKGFDLALSAHVGAATKPAPANASPAAQFAFNAALGAKNLTVSNQNTLIKTIAANPAMKEGAVAALRVAAPGATLEVSVGTKKPGFWRRLGIALGIVKE